MVDAATITSTPATTPANLQTQWARLLVTTVVQAGITDAVISPGSRSTPFVCACIQAAGLRCHQVIDERSAAFFALGQARASGRPSLLLCTSGTAGAHYLPAVIEARYAGVPLLVITADRPAELQRCGAPQTIDQEHLFGDHVRAFYSLGGAEHGEAALLHLRQRAADAVRQTLWPEPGAVHLNAALAKPLEPVVATTAEQQQLCVLVDTLCASPLPELSAAPASPASMTEVDHDAVAALARRCRQLARGFIVAGPAPIDHAGLRHDVRALSAATGYPVLCDLASQLGGGQPGDALLDGILDAGQAAGSLRPQIILQLGNAPVSPRFAQLISAADDIERFVLTEFGLCDPWRSATGHLRGSLFETLPALLAGLDELGPLVESAAPFSTTVDAARRHLIEVQRTLLDEPMGRCSEARAVLELMTSLPEDALLVLGNSLAIRVADLWGGRLPSGVAVLSQRGVSGIDGLLSGAIGAALVSGRPTALILGDVSLLHDLTALGLLALDGLQSALLVVVLNNDGGRIFEHLPIGGYYDDDSAEMEFWTTPHGRDFEHAARMFARPYQQLAPGESGVDAFSAAWQRRGLSLVEIAVPSDASLRLDQQLRRRLGRGRDVL